MGRFRECDDCDDADSPEEARESYDNRLREAITSEQGQRCLRELEAALLAMPNKRLIRGWLATPNGECCAIGLYCAAKDAAEKGIGITQAVTEMALAGWNKWCQEALDEGDSCPDGETYTMDEGTSAGLPWELAWELGWNNDEGHHVNPEERYRWTLAWVQKRIIRSSNEMTPTEEGMGE